VGDLIQIRSHPSFRKDEEELDTFESIQPTAPGVAICSSCVHLKNFNTFWQKLRGKESQRRLYCGAVSRPRELNPVTGETVYITRGYSESKNIPHELCLVVNPHGKCDKFVRCQDR
jgi:hypothetical protein